MTSFFVLTPTHNRAKLVARAIESVQKQTHGSWQHFIVDDGSRDGTWDDLAAFENDPRVHTYRFTENRGVNAARNFLLERILELGQPGFVVILDDDDWLTPNALDGIARAAEEQPNARWFIANSLDPGGTPVTKIRGPYRPLCYVRDHKLRKQLAGDVTHAFHTSIVGDNRYPERFENSEEWWFYAGLARQSRMHAIELDAKIKEHSEDGLMERQPNKHLAAEIWALKLERFEPLLGPRERASLEARVARSRRLRGDHPGAWRQLAHAFRSWPLEPRIYRYAVDFVARSLRDRLGRPESPTA